MKHYHYIFTGSGLSALMTVYEMVVSGKFEDKNILLIDETEKNSNDRTWCFWDEKNIFSDLISKKWSKTLFANKDWQREMNINPYQYKMIKSADFYHFISSKISSKNIHFINQKVVDFEELGNHCVVKTDSQSFTCNKIFNSIFNPKMVENQTKYPFLHQHFIGWFIKSKESVFNKDCATFMDFSVEQKGNTRFMYVLPSSKNEALIEYTLFSENHLDKTEYEDEIIKYIDKLGVSDYEIIEKEQGNIPMTCYPFWKHNTKNVINIGSAGGWTKASTGFTFKNTIKKSRHLVHFLSSENDFRKFHKKDKFWFYDLLFLDVLYKNNHLGSEIFYSMFKKTNPIIVFKFLDEETTLIEDLKVIWSCPKLPFIKAVFGRIF